MNFPKIDMAAVATAGRYALAVATGAATVGVATHVIDQGQAADLTTQMKVAVDAVGQIMTGLQSLVGAVMGIATVVAAAYGVVTSTLGSKAKAVVAASPAQAATVAQALVQAAPGTVVVTSPAIAAATPSPAVVANTEKAVVNK